MRIRIGFTILIILIFTAVSCGPPGSFIEENSAMEEIQILSIDKGSFISDKDSVPLSIEYDEENVFPDRLVIELHDENGNILGTQVIEGTEIAEKQLPSLELPELETGLYILTCSLYEGEDLLKQTESEFFVVSGEYTILGITSYPPVIPPQSKAVFKANIDYPEEADPYIVWSMGEKPIHSGYVSEGADSLNWQTPKNEGVFSIRVELFPFGPADGNFFTFQSEHTMSVEAFVTNDSDEKAGELAPASSYYALFHFRGNTEDSSAFSSERTVQIIGSPELALRGGLFGYFLDGSSGMEISNSVLPLEDGMLQPFTLNFRFMLEELQDENELIFVGDDSGLYKFAVDLLSSGAGKLVLQVGNDSVGLSTEEGVFTTDEIYDMSLSLISEDDILKVRWYINGEIVSFYEGPALKGSFPEKCRSRVGGENGFVGIIDEFGVFYQDREKRTAPDPYVFERAMRKKYSEDLRLAEGFDGIYLPEYISASESAEAGFGSLFLSPQAKADFPELTLKEETLSFQFDFLNEDTGITSCFLVTEAEIRELFRIDAEGYIEGFSNSLPSASKEKGVIEFRIQHTENSLFLIIGEDKQEIELPGDQYFSLVFSFLNPGEETPVYLDTVLIIKDNSRLAKEKQEEAVPEEPVNV